MNTYTYRGFTIQMTQDESGFFVFSSTGCVLRKFAIEDVEQPMDFIDSLLA